jgi:hypothetical protein
MGFNYKKQNPRQGFGTGWPLERHPVLLVLIVVLAVDEDYASRR